VVQVFPGDSGRARAYEDAGNDLGYRDGAASWTELGSAWSAGGRELRVHVGAAVGSYPGMPGARAVTVRVPHALPPTAVESDGEEIPWRPDGATPGWSYEGDKLAVVVRLAAGPVDEERSLTMTFPEGDATLLDGLAGTLARVRAAVDVLEHLWPADWPPESLIDVGQAGHLAALDPPSAVETLTRARAVLPAEIDKVRGLTGDDALVNRALAILGAEPRRRSRPRRRRRR
jgi:hypothetical protein